MKKFIITLLLMSVAIFAHGQQTTVEGSKFFHNTSVSVYTGAMGWINPAVTNESTFFQGVRPAVGIAANKWFTPGVGFEIFYDVSAGSLPFSPNAKRWTAFDFMNLGVNGQLNLNNIFHHYKGQPDIVEVVPFAGLGWGHGFTKRGGSNLYAPNPADNTTNFMTANLGIKVDFNMGKQRAWQINVRPSIHYMLAGERLPVQFNSQRAYVALQVGATYKFGRKNSKGERTHNFTKGYTSAEYDFLATEYRNLQNLYNEKPKVVEKEVEKVVEKEVPVEIVKTVTAMPEPHFVQKLAIVDATSVAALDVLAQTIKDSDDKYVITGYASEEGNLDFNVELSRKRAEAIKKCLVDRGVNTDRLSTVAGGPTTQFGDTYEANRRVVVEKK